MTCPRCQKLERQLSAAQQLAHQRLKIIKDLQDQVDEHRHRGINEDHLEPLLWGYDDGVGDG